MAKTLAQLRTKCRQSMDNISTSALSNTYLDELIRDAVSEIHREILALKERYFEVPSTLTTVAASAKYADFSLPSDIFADKITLVVYDKSDSERYELPRVRDRMFIHDVDVDDDYQWDIVNLAAGKKLRIYPAPRISGTTEFSVYYIRKAKTLSSESDANDIPEFEDLIPKFVRYYRFRDKDDKKAERAERDYLEGLDRLRMSLTPRFEDNDNEIPQDMRHYEESI